MERLTLNVLDTLISSSGRNLPCIIVVVRGAGPDFADFRSVGERLTAYFSDASEVEVVNHMQFRLLFGVISPGFRTFAFKKGLPKSTSN